MDGNVNKQQITDYESIMNSWLTVAVYLLIISSIYRADSYTSFKLAFYEVNVLFSRLFSLFFL